MGIKAIKSIENTLPDATMFDISNMVKVKQEPITNYYKFVKKVGEGTYGEVFKAEQEKTGNIRAIKKINSLKFPRAKMMTLNEMSLLKALVSE
jgi:serine/threonine protein kinase